MAVAGMMAVQAQAVDFNAWWPYIYDGIQNGVTNVENGGFTTNAAQYVTRAGRVVTLKFPVTSGSFTQVVYTVGITYMNVSGGILTMSGSPTGGVYVVELTPAALQAAGFATTEGTPLTSWLINNGFRVKREATGLSVRNYGDTAYGDLTLQDLFVMGTQHISNVEVLEVSTNRIILNSSVTSGVPVLDGWVEVRRGAEPSAYCKWDESRDEWLFGFGTNLMSAGDSGKHSVTSSYPQIINFGAAACEAVSNARPHVYNITAAEIWNWNHTIAYSDALATNAVAVAWPHLVAILPAHTANWTRAWTDATWLTNWVQTSQWVNLPTVQGMTNDAVNDATNKAYMAAKDLTSDFVTGSVVTNLSTNCVLVAGANVTLSAVTNGGTVTYTVASSGGGGGGVSGGGYYVFARNSAAHTFNQQVWTKLNFSNEISDIAGVFTNSRYTVASNGVYSFKAGLAKSDNTIAGIALFTNGVRSMAATGSSTTDSDSGVWIGGDFRLKTNEYVEAYGYWYGAVSATAGTNTASFFQGVNVGSGDSF